MLNHIVIMGRLTRDPELRYTQSQTPVASFTVAVDRDFGGRDGGEKQTDFIDCVAWRQTAEFVSKYFTKGRMIIVIGRIATRTWEGQDGKKNYVTEVVANEISFGESKRSQESGGYTAPAPAAGIPSAPAAPAFPENTAEDDFTPLLDTDDDLPF